MTGAIKKVGTGIATAILIGAAALVDTVAPGLSRARFVLPNGKVVRRPEDELKLEAAQAKRDRKQAKRAARQGG